MKIFKIAILVAVILVGIVLISAFYTVIKNSNQTTQEPDTQEDVYGELSGIYDKSNPTIAEAFSASGQGDFSKAGTLFKQARESATNPAQEAHLLFLEARAVEQYDRLAAIDLFKEVIKNPDYPSRQKTYAALRLPFQFTATSDVTVLERILSTEPYASMRAPSTAETLKNLYEYSLTFGDGRLAYAANSQSLSTQEMSVRSENLKRARALFEQGEAELVKAKELSTIIDYDSALIPVTYRERARANALMALAGEEQALRDFDRMFAEALSNTLKNKGDGAVRFDTFVYNYLLSGAPSFVKTEDIIRVLFERIEEYESMDQLFKKERDNVYGSKNLFVSIANEHEPFKTFLMEKAGWAESDFAI
jgi:tetratricopeptide (TPR) repeat protein